MDNWLVYILECSDSTYYCGITNDLEKRLSKHNNGKGAKYTRGRVPVRVVACSGLMSKSEALKLERLVKRQKKANKIQFLENFGVVT